MACSDVESTLTPSAGLGMLALVGRRKKKQQQPQRALDCAAGPTQAGDAITSSQRHGQRNEYAAEYTAGAGHAALLQATTSSSTAVDELPQELEQLEPVGADPPPRRVVIVHRTASGGAAGTGSGRRRARHDLAGPCNHCGAVTSPQWRKGPKGKPILCNACGIRFLRNRTLAKVAPKKRRHSAGADGATKRPKAEASEAAEQDAEVPAAQEAALPAADGAAQACSALTSLSQPQAQAPPEEAEQGEQAPSLGRASGTTLQLPSPSSGSRRVLAGGDHAPGGASGSSNSRLGGLGALGSSASLALTLALQQHQQQLQGCQRGHAQPGSPAAKAATAGAGAPALAAASGSPVSHSSAFQLQQCDSPVSPLLLASSPGLASCAGSADSPCGAATGAGAAEPRHGGAPPGAAGAEAADLLQLVAQLGALTGMGPAVEFLRLCSGDPAAMAAAAAAALRAVADFRQQQ